MRRRRHWKVAVAAALLCAAAQGGPARAANMDITPDRLFTTPAAVPAGLSCQDVAAGLTGSGAQQFLDSHPGLDPHSAACVANNVAWANLMSELGYAIAPTAFHPARTTGFGGFALTLEATFAHVNADALDSTGTAYWHLGTRGPVDAGTGRFSVVNRNPDSILQIYSLLARKGLPYGFEIAGAIGYLANTSMWVAGGDVHWALLEGYRTGVLGYLPDVAVGGGVRTLVGAPSFSLTTVGLDAELSKPFTLEGSAVVSPFVGVQRLMIFADSSAVNLTPNVDPLAQCGYLGTNVPGNPSAPGPPYDGAPVCKNTLTTSDGTVIPNDSDFQNQVAFHSARIYRWRALAGATYRYGVLQLGAEFAFDLEEPRTENAGLGISGARQWTLSLEGGVTF